MKPQEFCDEYCDYDNDKVVCDACYVWRVLGDMNKEIDELKSENADLHKAQEWIPVGERLPEEDKLVNIVRVSRKKTYVTSGYLSPDDDGEKEWYADIGDGFKMSKVQHVILWQPLPALPDQPNA